MKVRVTNRKMYIRKACLRTQIESSRHAVLLVIVSILYLSSTSPVHRETIRQGLADPLIRHYPSPQILRSRPDCDVLSLSGSIIVPWDCHRTLKLLSSFWILDVDRSPDMNRVFAHRSCMLETCGLIFQGSYLIECVFSFYRFPRGPVMSSH